MYIAKKVIVFTIGMAASSYSVQAAPIFTLSSLAFFASPGENVTGTATPTTSTEFAAAFNSVTNSTPIYTTVITRAPTSTKAGVATTFEKITATTIHTDASYTDKASFQIKNSTASIEREQQIIRLTGLVTANIATTLTYQVIGDGPYAKVKDGLGRFKLPDQPVLWFATGSTRASVEDNSMDAQLSARRSLLSGSMYMESSDPFSIKMMPGDQLYVAAEIDTGKSTGISNFVLNFTSAIYGGVVQAPTMADASGAPITSAIAPIPEPGTDAMFLAGLGVMGMLIARKKTSA